jgi:hypothetical protein
VFCSIVSLERGEKRGAFAPVREETERHDRVSGTESLPENEADDADATNDEEGDAVSCPEKNRRKSV